jgi:PTS system mannose-specific IIA component
MVGVLIIAHSIYGEALARSASHVLGQLPPRLQALGMTVRDDPDAVLERAREILGELDDGRGVLVLTDILGATPSNLATRLIAPGRVEVVAGVNLSMLVRALTYRHEPLATVVRKAVSGGMEGVVHVVAEAQIASGRS